MLIFCDKKDNKAYIKSQSLLTSILDANHSDMAHEISSVWKMPLSSD